ncbi:MAG: riboflavin biosynthesis protein RibF [Gemmatimonadota bacterium]
MRTALTVGSFDGVHRGHAAVLAALRGAADRLGLSAEVVTFEPHPLRVLRPEAAPARLASPAERALWLTEAGVDRVHVLPFTPELAALEAAPFVRDVLVGRLGCTALVVGHDHRLGRGRGGGPEELARLASELGFELQVVPPVHVDGAPVSSTRTRQAVAGGDLGLAARLLGRPYALFGPVVRGSGRGAGLGVPTANLAPAPGKQLPPEGIYACRVSADGERYPAAVHWGARPTFADATPVLEAHLIGFDGDLYGRWLELAFLEKIRDVARFGSPGDLARAMADDLRRAADVTRPSLPSPA